MPTVTLAEWRNLVWYLTMAATALLLCQMIAQKLARIYPVLFAYFGVSLLHDLVGVALVRRPVTYFYVYSSGEIIRLGLAVLVILELYRVALASHPAIAEFGRRAALYVVLSLGLVALAGLYFGPTSPQRMDGLLRAVFAFERTMDSVLALLLLVIVSFLTWFPVQVRRNAAICVGGFAAYFLSRWAMTWAINANPSRGHVFDIGQSLITLACLAACAALLRTEGELQKVVTGHRWNPEEMQRLTVQLDAINARLIRVDSV